MVAVDYMTEPESRVGTPQVLFERKFADINGATYDLHPDGSRFLPLEPSEQARADHLELVVN